MKNCPNCGSANLDEARYCGVCGKSLEETKPTTFTNTNQQKAYTYGKANDSIGAWWLLGAFIPLVGLILFLVWKDEYPKRAKSAGIGALVVACIEVIISIIYFIAVVAFFF